MPSVATEVLLLSNGELQETSPRFSDICNALAEFDVAYTVFPLVDFANTPAEPIPDSIRCLIYVVQPAVQVDRNVINSLFGELLTDKSNLKKKLLVIQPEEATGRDIPESIATASKVFIRTVSLNDVGFVRVLVASLGLAEPYTNLSSLELQQYQTQLIDRLHQRDQGPHGIEDEDEWDELADLDEDGPIPIIVTFGHGDPSVLASVLATSDVLPEDIARVAAALNAVHLDVGGEPLEIHDGGTGRYMRERVGL